MCHAEDVLPVLDNTRNSYTRERSSAPALRRCFPISCIIQASAERAAAERTFAPSSQDIKLVSKLLIERDQFLGLDQDLLERFEFALFVTHSELGGRELSAAVRLGVQARRVVLLLRIGVVCRRPEGGGAVGH